MAARLSRLGGRGHQVGEERATYGSPGFGPDSDLEVEEGKLHRLRVATG
jgi:hypothetical protein